MCTLAHTTYRPSPLDTYVHAHTHMHTQSHTHTLSRPGSRPPVPVEARQGLLCPGFGQQQFWGVARKQQQPAPHLALALGGWPCSHPNHHWPGSLCPRLPGPQTEPSALECRREKPGRGGARAEAQGPGVSGMQRAGHGTDVSWGRAVPPRGRQQGTNMALLATSQEASAAEGTPHSAHLRARPRGAWGS